MSLSPPSQQKQQRRPHSNTVSGVNRPLAIDTLITSGLTHRRNSEGSPRALVAPPINVSAPSPTQSTHLDSPKTLSLQHHFPDTAVMPSSSEDDAISNNHNLNNNSRAATPPIAIVPEPSKSGTVSRLFGGHKKPRSRGSSLSTHSVNELPDTHAEKQALGSSKLRNEPIVQPQPQLQPQQHRGSDDASSERSFTAGSIVTTSHFEPANAKRNQDFHALFRSVPEEDPLLEGMI